MGIFVCCLFLETGFAALVLARRGGSVPLRAEHEIAFPGDKYREINHLCDGDSSWRHQTLMRRDVSCCR